jgi:hypothetical protein
MALELHIFTAREFIRLGAHGDLDWNSTRELLATLARAFVLGGSDLAILDIRDASASLNDDQLVALVHVLRQAGFRQNHRLAVLHHASRHVRSDFFAAAAVHMGFDVGSFESYEQAVEWLSHVGGKDPLFYGETYIEPTDTEEPKRPPSHGGHGS